jgi:membrane-bound lytic murein transglycosylase
VLEYLKTVNVQNPKEIAALLSRYKQFVQFSKEPNKTPVVKSFGKRIPTVIALHPF